MKAFNNFQESFLEGLSVGWQSLAGMARKSRAFLCVGVFWREYTVRMLEIIYPTMQNWIEGRKPLRVPPYHAYPDPARVIA